MSSSTINSICFGTAVLSCAAINFIGLRFLLAPRVAAAGYGVSETDSRAFTAIKGIRDITSGIVPLVVLNVAGRKAFGWTMVAASITAVGDALIVLSRGGKMSTALGVHGVTAAVLITIGLVMGRGV